MLVSLTRQVLHQMLRQAGKTVLYLREQQPPADPDAAALAAEASAVVADGALRRVLVQVKPRQQIQLPPPTWQPPEGNWAAAAAAGAKPPEPPPQYALHFFATKVATKRKAARNTRVVVVGACCCPRPATFGPPAPVVAIPVHAGVPGPQPGTTGPRRSDSRTCWCP